MTVYDLIAAHSAAYAAFDRATEATDDVVAARAGRVVTLEDQDARDHADDEEVRALEALLAHVPSNVAQLRMMSHYLTGYVSTGHGLEGAQAATLLRSISKFQPY